MKIEKPLCVLLLLLTIGCTRTYRVPFWSELNHAEQINSAEELHALGYSEDPCGVVKYFEISKISPSFEGDEINEFDDQGRIIRRWKVPARSTFMTVSLENIVVQSDNNMQLQISLSGELEENHLPSAEQTRIACPQNIQEQIQSSYLTCVEVKDATTALVRKIAYDGPCT